MDSVQASGFGVYFRRGAESRLPWHELAASCQSKYLVDVRGVKFSNALLHRVLAFLWDFGVRKARGTWVTTCAAILLVV